MSDGYNATPGRSAPARHRNPIEPTESAESSGCHTDGELTVAALIAKLGGTPIPQHRRAAPEAVDEHRQQWHAAPVATLLAPEYASEIPDLDLIYRMSTENLPSAAPPVSPLRIGRPPAAPPAARPKPRRRPMLLAGRTLAALIAVLALAATGAAWQWSNTKNNNLNQVSALDLDSRDIVDPHAQYGDENFLIVGADSRAGENSAMGAGDTEDAGGARSDTIMLVNIPANRKRVVVVSFPRDLAITPLYCESWNPDTGEYGALYDEDSGGYGPRYRYTETKLNSTYSYGGPKCLVKEIQKLSGLSINRFMAVDFAGFAKMVDALGGVEVCSPTKLYDYELGTVLDHSGRQVIDGATALNYVRARNVTTEFNGDYGRIKRQQRFLSSLLRSLISKDTFYSLSKLNNVVNMFINDSQVDNVKTKDLVTLGQSLQGVAAGHITFVTVPTGVTDENGDEPPRKSDMQLLFNAIINDDPLPGENNLNATSSPTTASSAGTTATPEATTDGTGEQVQTVATTPGKVTVRVSNSTSASGLATTASNELKQHGFRVMAPDDFPSSLTATTVLFSPGNERAAATVASAFADSPVERVTGMGSVVQVVLGADFRAVTAPAPSGSAVNVQVTRRAGGALSALPEDLTVTNAADTTCE